MNKHLAAYIFAALFALFGAPCLVAGLWPVVHGGSPTITLVLIGFVCLVVGAGLAASSDLGQALNAAAPLLNRVPLGDTVRGAVVQRVTQSVKASDIKVDGPG